MPALFQTLRALGRRPWYAASVVSAIAIGCALLATALVVVDGVLFVVGIGILGQLAMSTARRTREVGIRMSCGASRRSVAGLILFEQLRAVLTGLVTGAIVAAWGVRFVGTYLYQLSSFDARAWGAAIGLILLTAAAGTLIPALRASRIDPAQALKTE